MARLVAVLLNEAVEGRRIEAQEVSPFDVRDPTLKNQPTDVTHVDAKSLRYLID